MNVSSILIQCRPEWIKAVIEEVSAIESCTYHLHDEKGRIIVTIEGESVEEEINVFNLLKRIEHVIAADVMYAYSEDELERERDKLEAGEEIPAWLNDESIRAEDINYKGDLKKKF